MKRLKRALKPQLKRLWYTILTPTVKVNPTPPIIILGNQKSGTTAIAALLAEYTGLSVTLDLVAFSGLFSKLYNDQLQLEKLVQIRRFEFSKDIIKEPNLTFFYTELRQLFPNARFVIIVRDPRDNIRSILNRLDIRGDLEKLDSKTWKRLNPIWCSILDGRYLNLQGSTYIEKLASRWNRACDVYLQHPGEMMLVRYEDFAADKVGLVDSIASELGYPQANNIDDIIDVQYQPRGKSDISWNGFFGPRNLARIETTCDGRMQKFGYRVSALAEG